VIVSDERLDHDLGGLVQVIFGDCGNDSVSLTTPAPAEGGQERKHDNKDAECSSHGDLGCNCCRVPMQMEHQQGTDWN
jgi:hypothetical protein